MDGKTFWQIYDIIDGWYHEQTRHHLEDVGNSKQLVENVEAYLTRVQVELLNDIIQDGALQGEWVSVEWLKRLRAKLRKENNV